MQLKQEHIQIFSANLVSSAEDELQQFNYLSPEEQQRAERFVFPIHRKRFITAHYILRKILGGYLNLAPDKIIFAYTEYAKPYLDFPKNSSIQFNLAHSHDIALYAFRLDYPVGIDIEKIESDYNADLVARFFHPQEINALQTLAQEEQSLAFFRVWSRKEAFIKAVGSGLSIPLTSFSVSIEDTAEKIFYANQAWYLSSINYFPGFQAAVASSKTFTIAIEPFGVG